ncbi:hypothetical protein RM543_11870 [Roseicyclus sp. F158]|uniref:Uncharacterized protein n=1 Tax=Tropicimonas omnivorans TaxID=3075590 RepID=A0ABU3DI36_9RHOB|nr:hypothetical protein [Roseicyclus sp. F158]MDT0683386.1 hypothetical protein [Roseicyclus sp. F158]
MSAIDAIRIPAGPSLPQAGRFLSAAPEDGRPAAAVKAGPVPRGALSAAPDAAGSRDGGLPPAPALQAAGTPRPDRAGQSDHVEALLGRYAVIPSEAMIRIARHREEAVLRPSLTDAARITGPSPRPARLDTSR